MIPPIGSDVELSAEQFEQIVGPLKADQSAKPRNRHHPRVGVRTWAAVLLLGGRQEGASESRTVKVRIVDLSSTGMRFLHPAAMKPGARILLRLPRSDGSTLCVPGAIRHCRPAGPNQHAIGVRLTPVRFEAPPPAPRGRY